MLRILVGQEFFGFLRDFGAVQVFNTRAVLFKNLSISSRSSYTLVWGSEQLDGRCRLPGKHRLWLQAWCIHKEAVQKMSLADKTLYFYKTYFPGTPPRGHGPTGAAGKGVPLTDSLGLFHGGSCSQYVLGFKGHHGLHLQDGGISQSMVHAVFGSVRQQHFNYSTK